MPRASHGSSHFSPRMSVDKVGEQQMKRGGLMRDFGKAGIARAPCWINVEHKGEGGARITAKILW